MECGADGGMAGRKEWQGEADANLTFSLVSCEHSVRPRSLRVRGLE
jgi:hypothetical protein